MAPPLYQDFVQPKALYHSSNKVRENKAYLPPKKGVNKSTIRTIFISQDNKLSEATQPKLPYGMPSE